MKMMKWCGLFFFSLFLVGCSKNEVVGTQKAMTQVRNLPVFSELNISGYYDVNITLGPVQSVSLRSNGDILPYIETNVKSSTLTIAAKKHYTLRPQGIPAVDIVVPTLSTISLNGNNLVNLKGPVKGNLDLHFSGSNQFTAVGKLETMSMELAGNTLVDAAGLTARDVKIDTTGSSKISVNASNSLKVKIAGTAVVTYLGNPSVEKEITGSGSVTQASAVAIK